MKLNRMQAAGLGLALVAVLGGDALAQVQSKDQAKCLTSMAKTARKISGAVLKDSVNCIRKGAAGQLPPGETAEHCLIADLKGKVAKARASLDATELKSCAVAPDFAFPGAAVTGDAYSEGNLNLLEDGFGASLDATLAASDGADPDGRCSAVLPAAWRKLEDAMQKAVEACLKTGLKEGTILAPAGFEACYQSILTDSRGKVAKAVALVSAQLSSKCPAGSLSLMFPGLTPICAVYGAGSDAAGLAACSRDRLECRTCLMFNAAFGLHRDCDQFDDALANGSCPACGNTVIDADEQCDDGNVVSGDGCTAA
jgi:cysteine-rich repeat protein